MVYGNAQYIVADGNVIGPCVHVEPFRIHRLENYSDIIAQPAAFFRRSAYEAVDGLDTRLNYGMDYDLWIKLARRFKVAYLPILLANYRWLTDNKTAIGGFARLNEITWLAAAHGLREPAYIRLERVNLYLREALKAIRRLAPGDFFVSAVRASAIMLRSPRAIASLFQPRTWRIIWMGQVLRARAVKAKDKSEI
jgi:hypothetical protein